MYFSSRYQRACPCLEAATEKSLEGAAASQFPRLPSPRSDPAAWCLSHAIYPSHEAAPRLTRPLAFQPWRPAAHTLGDAARVVQPPICAPRFVIHGGRAGRKIASPSRVRFFYTPSCARVVMDACRLRSLEIALMCKRRSVDGPLTTNEIVLSVRIA